MQTIRYIRRCEVLARFGTSNSTLFNRINDGIFIPPVSLGERAVGWLEHEVDAVLGAMAAGKSKMELKQLVKDLVKGRQKHLNAGTA